MIVKFINWMIRLIAYGFGDYRPYHYETIRLGEAICLISIFIFLILVLIWWMSIIRFIYNTLNRIEFR